MRAAGMLSGPTAGVDEPIISDRELIDLATEGKGFACLVPSKPDRRDGATTRSSGRSSALELTKLAQKYLEVAKIANLASTIGPSIQNPDLDSTPSEPGDMPAAPPG